MANTKRLQLQALLESTLGSRNVYFQPPSNIKMKYPCIVYKLSNVKSKYADDKLYKFNKSYTITLIDPNPDTGLIDKLLELPTCAFEQHYVMDNLNHDVFRLYY